MNVLLVYDIVNDRKRSKVADTCLDYGLDRIQYSTFSGQLNRTHREELMMKIEAIMGDSAASVHLYSIDEKAWSKRLVFEQDVKRLLVERDEYEIPESADE
jgi:CRISPR-associated protein Cas2